MDKATQIIGREMEQVEAEWKATGQNLKELQQLDHTEPPIERLYGALDATKVHTSEKRDADDEGWRDLKVGAWFETMPARRNSPINPGKSRRGISRISATFKKPRSLVS